MDRDDEHDLDLEAAAKRLTGEDKPKKKPRAKAKGKKVKTDSEAKSSSRSQNSLPLSMLDGSSEDKALYEARLSAQKNSANQAKEYKMSQPFKVGEVLNHKTFGIGFVVAECGTNKIEVLFSKGRKLLVAGMS